MRKNFKFLCCVILFCFCVAGLDLNANVNSHNKVVVCYVGGWAAYFHGNGQFLVENIDPMLCTHIIYGYADLDNVTHSIQSGDSELDTEEDGGKGQYKKVVNLKQKNPKLKVSIAIGGHNEESRTFSDMADKIENRKKFIESVLTFIRKYGFDGLDVDWQYPGWGDGSRFRDRENFSILLKEMRTEFDKNGFILTVTIDGILRDINRSYDVRAINQHVHFIHVMAFNYHRPDESQTTGHKSPLRMSVNSSTDQSGNVEDTVKYLLKSGASPDKLVLGVEFAGRTFKLADINLHEVAQRR